MASNFNLPMKEIPGSYGVPFFSAIADRLDFYYNRAGTDGFFRDRVSKYDSTVLRTNVAPGPFMAPDPRVIVLTDAQSFPVLFDTDKVEKRNVLCGTYVPPVSLTGGYRTCAYLDPSEPKHEVIKQLVFSLLAARRDRFVPEFRSTFSELFDAMDAELAGAAGKSDFNKLNDNYSFEYVGRALFGMPPSSTELGDTGGAKVTKWLVFTLHPQMSLGLPKLLEELVLHTFHLPAIFVKSDYDDLYRYFESASAAFLDGVEKLGVSKEEACHNLLFVGCFNAYGGMKLLFPGILRFLAESGAALHERLAREIRTAVDDAGGEVTLAALERMELTKSFVYEALRMDPPVKLQYGHAKTDLVISNHDASFTVKRGEMLLGYQPLATRDGKVFE